MKTLSIACLLALAVALAADMPLIQPQEFAAQLKAKSGKPLLLHVGFAVLYRSKHIPGSVFVGPGANADGIASLRSYAGKLPRTTEIVVYCGCCPWDHCPNIKPAMETLRQMGFTKVKALYIPTNMLQDWYDKGYPAEAGSAAQ